MKLLTQPFSGAGRLVDQPIPRCGSTVLEFREPS